MTDLEFTARAEELFARVERACDQANDAADADIDNQRVGGLLTLGLAKGGQIVINLQRPLHEVWLATKAGGYHYRFDGSHWRDTKGEGEFFDVLARSAKAQGGVELDFESVD